MTAGKFLRSILRAAHCRGTHHRLALDALPLVQTHAGIRLVRLILRHHDRYLTGATDPDTRFRDFQNHVIHVADGYWGGAPRVAHRWYDRMQRYLRSRRYADAAHAAGVLSHYFTDPFQPLHTQQCDREKILHRPIEWSITRSFDEIWQTWQQDEMRIVFQLSGGTGWLGEAILHGAKFSNRRYTQLLDHYDIAAAARDPAAGLSPELRTSMAELFGLAITGWARVLERAAADAEAIAGKPLPTTSLLLPSVAALVKAPWRLGQRWTAYAAEQWEIEQLFDEFRRTGELRQHLPAEVDIVHRVVDVHRDEQRWRHQRERRMARGTTVVRVESSASQPQESPPTLPFPRHKPEQSLRRSA